MITLGGHVGVITGLVVMGQRRVMRWGYLLGPALCALNGLLLHVYILGFRGFPDMPTFLQASAFWAAVFRMHVTFTTFGIIAVNLYIERGRRA